METVVHNRIRTSNESSEHFLPYGKISQNRKQLFNKNGEKAWTVNHRLLALTLYNFVRAFIWAYKRRGIYLGEGLINVIKKTFRNEL